MSWSAFRNGVTPGTKESREWFREKAKQLRGPSINRDQLLTQSPVKRRARLTMGSMVMFYYDPKWKHELPYYDKFPLVIPYAPKRGMNGEPGFLGLNLHYLPPILRFKLFAALLKTADEYNKNESARFNFTHSMLNASSRTKYYKPCVKHYLDRHVRSQFAEVQPQEWEIAIALPIAQWEKASHSRVYVDSRRKI